MRFGRRHQPEPVDAPVEVDRLRAYADAVESMPVQCLMFDDDGRLTVFAAFSLSDDDIVALDSAMGELPPHPPVSPASWLDQHLDRWHHGRFAGWRLRREHVGPRLDAIVHPDLGSRGHVATLRNVAPSAGVHLLGPYVRYGTGQSTGARRVTVDHDQRCVELLFRRTVEAGVPISRIALLPEHPATVGVAGPPLTPRGASSATVASPGGWDPPMLPMVSSVDAEMADQLRALVHRVVAAPPPSAPMPDESAGIDAEMTDRLRALVHRVVADASPVESVAAAKPSRELQST